MVKNPPAIQETWVHFLGREDPLEKGMVTHSSTLAWEIPWTEEPGGLQSVRLHRVRHDWVTNTFTSLSFFRTFAWTCAIAPPWPLSSPFLSLWATVYGAGGAIILVILLLKQQCPLIPVPGLMKHLMG